MLFPPRRQGTTGGSRRTQRCRRSPATLGTGQAPAPAPGIAIPSPAAALSLPAGTHHQPPPANQRPGCVPRLPQPCSGRQGARPYPAPRRSPVPEGSRRLTPLPSPLFPRPTARPRDAVARTGARRRPVATEAAGGNGGRQRRARREPALRREAGGGKRRREAGGSPAARRAFGARASAGESLTGPGAVAGQPQAAAAAAGAGEARRGGAGRGAASPAAAEGLG